MIFKNSECNTSSSSMTKEDAVNVSSGIVKRPPVGTSAYVGGTKVSEEGMERHHVPAPPAPVEETRLGLGPPKPFFIMDWLENIDPAKLAMARRVLKTPKKTSGPQASQEAPSRRAITVQPLFDSDSSKKEYKSSTIQMAAEATGNSKPPRAKPGSFFRRKSIAIGNAYNAKGLAKAKKGLWEDALACWENALAIRNQVLGKDHIDVANTYNNLGIAYGKLEQQAQAISLLQIALDSRTAYYGTNQHPQVAATLHNIGNVLQQSGELDAAVDYFARAKDIQQDVFSPQHVQVARAGLAMGHAYYQGKNYEKAHEAFCDALIVFESVAGFENNAGGVDYSVEIEGTRADVQELEELMYRS